MNQQSGYTTAAQWAFTTSGQVQPAYSGGNSTPTYSFSADPDTGMRLTTAGNLRLSATTDAAFLDVDAVNLRINTNRYIRVSESRNELLSLNQTSATGSPYISWNQNGTRRMYLSYNNSNAYTYLVNENGGTIELQTTADEALTVRVSNATGNPYISLANNDGYKGYWQSYDDGTTYFGTAIAGAATHIRDFGNAINLLTLDYNAAYMATFNANVDSVVRINTTSATGSPYIAFSQNLNRRAYIQYADSGDWLNIVNEVDGVRIYAANSIRIQSDSTTSTQCRTGFLNGQVYAAEYQTQYEDTGTVNLDWDLGNQLVIDFDSTSTTTTIDIQENLMQAGGSYVVLLQYNGGSAQTVAWTGTGLLWANGDVPTTATGATAGDITVVQFFKTTTATPKIIGSYFVVT